MLILVPLPLINKTILATTKGILVLFVDPMVFPLLEEVVLMVVIPMEEAMDEVVDNHGDKDHSVNCVGSLVMWFSSTGIILMKTFRFTKAITHNNPIQAWVQ